MGDKRPCPAHDVRRLEPHLSRRIQSSIVYKVIVAFGQEFDCTSPSLLVQFHDTVNYRNVATCDGLVPKNDRAQQGAISNCKTTPCQHIYIPRNACCLDSQDRCSNFANFAPRLGSTRRRRPLSDGKVPKGGSTHACAHAFPGRRTSHFEDQDFADSNRIRHIVGQEKPSVHQQIFGGCG